jgi:succinate dehydrogenase / fumarate reductase cytochrome b subunit
LQQDNSWGAKGRGIKMAATGRPISPHLQIYRWYLSMALSIAHRVTGSALGVGLLLLTWWLVALASGPEAFATVQAAMDNILGFLVLFGFTAALFFHLCSGIRHLVWDAGFGFEIRTARQSGVAVLIATAVLTVLTWLIILIAG